MKGSAVRRAAPHNCPSCVSMIDRHTGIDAQTDKKAHLRVVGGQHSIPNMAESLTLYFRDVTPSRDPNSGHFVPEEQPTALANELILLLTASDGECAPP